MRPQQRSGGNCGLEPSRIVPKVAGNPGSTLARTTEAPLDGFRSERPSYTLKGRPG